MGSRRRRVGLLAGAAVALAAMASAGALLLRPPWSTSAAGPPTFVDETATSGLVQRYDGPDLFQVGGGVAVFDCDGDGRQDVYLAGGEHPASLWRNASPIGGALRFERIPTQVTNLSGVNGAYPLDWDGDGEADLIVLRNGENAMFLGRGDCKFEAVHGFAGTDGFTTAFSATWENDATLPTLAFGHYLRLDEDGERVLECDTNDLLRQDEDVAPRGPTYAYVELAPGYCALSMLFSDWDGSGRRDLRVSNDRQWYTDGMEQLWRVAPGEEPRLYSADEGWGAMKIWGMGIASQDLTGDGLPEVYLTSQGDNKLQTLVSGPGKPAFKDIALKSGVTSAQPFTGGESLPSTAWHPEFADVNNDGFSDLFVSKGNVGAQVGYATRDPNDLFLGQPDGVFVQAADRAGLVRYERGRGAALADFNLDGLLDLIVVNYGADTVVWRNVGGGSGAAPAPMGHWLMLEVQDVGPNRDAIGAKLEIRIGERVTTRELTVGGGHVGGQLGWTHIGLGPATSSSVRVTWPDGEVGPWLEVPADAFSRIERGAYAVRAWTPPAD